MSKIQRIRELVELLNHYRNEYYNNSNSEISDFEYDKLFDELSMLESETGFIMVTSPTQTVGYEVKSELTKVKHNHPMLSLDKTKSIDDIVKFLGNQDGICMAKMDGLTCSLRYVNGELVSAETRGDGEIGEDILHCAKTIKNIPLKIECLDEIIVDGEVIISYDDFEKINETLPEDKRYKHPRNLASGSIRQLDSSVAAQRNMQFVAWKLVKGSDNNSFSERLKFVAKLGFTIVAHGHIRKNDGKCVIEAIVDQLKNMAKDVGYPIDGCVFGYDDIAYGESLGATGHHLRSQMAFKFYDELYPTRLQYIDWTIGKSSQLTPTAVFESVEIDGTDVTRASLHNISIIKNLGLTKGCTINVFKANQIIPQIDSCENDGNGEIEIPSRCPICASDTVIKKDNGSEVLMCINPNCAGKKLAEFVHFVSRKCMNIDGLSEATLEKLISLGYINDFRSVYRLSKFHDQLIKVGGMGPKSVEKLLLAIEKSRNVRLENFIAALGIPNIGLSAAKTIATKFNNSFNDWIDAYTHGFHWDTLDDFGETMANNIDEYLEYNIMAVIKLADEMNFILPEKHSVNDNTFDGKVLCVTGKLNHFTRDSINEKIAALGAKAVGSVSKKTDYLITNEASGSSKYKKAVELGVPIITEEEFLSMCYNKID
ncbi:MAG: NAD-dependent DNA ligase LigA [Kiritimatiellae bacterium]|nr:NAD-dependent DNA ligase LigA [Kiritimatiellia bacterium]